MNNRERMRASNRLAVNELLSDKEKAEKLAVNGNAFVKNNMTWNVVLQKYIQFYEDLLKD